MPFPANAPAWLDYTTAITDFEVDVAFMLQPAYYVGDENDHRQLARRADFSEPLYQPASAPSGLVTTRGLRHHEPELLRHYRQVVALARQHHRVPGRSYFWLRPLLRVPGAAEPLLPLCWHYTLHDTRSLLLAPRNPRMGSIHYNTDESWELEIWSYQDRLYFRESRSDEAEEWLINLDRAEFGRQAANILAETEALLGRLTQELGADYWQFGPGGTGPA